MSALTTEPLDGRELAGTNRLSIQSPYAMNISFVYWIWSHDHPFQRWNKWPVNNAFMLLHVYLYEHPNWCLFCPGFEPGTRKFKSKETSVLPLCQGYSIQSCRRFEPVTSYLAGWDSEHWAMGMATEYYQEISPNFWVSALTTEPLGRWELVMTICEPRTPRLRTSRRAFYHYAKCTAWQVTENLNLENLSLHHWAIANYYIEYWSIAHKPRFLLGSTQSHQLTADCQLT